VRKHNTRVKQSAKRFRRLTVVTVVAVVILAIGAISVLSRQRSEAVKNSQKAAATPMNTRLAPQDLHQDAPTPQAQQLTDAEAQKLADGLKGLVNQSTDGLVETQHADGSVSVNLEDRFQSVTVARVNKDGSISQSCVDNPKAAGAFFGIDPKLIDPTIDRQAKKQYQTSTVRN
jgi:Sec-independent protein translocase protein TatA